MNEKVIGDEVIKKILKYDEQTNLVKIHESVFAIRPNHDVVTSEYLYLMFKHPAIVKKLTNKSTGSIF